MNSANDIIQELRELNSILADMPRTMPYEVPAGYFDALSGAILQAADGNEHHEPALHLPKLMPYELPAGYFDALADSVLAQVKEPALPFTKELPYAVPSGYFDKLPEDVLSKVKLYNTDKTFVFPVWKTIRWAAAAMLLLGAGFGLYTYMNNTTSPDVHEQLAMLSKDSISAYVDMHIDEFELETIASALEAGDVSTLTDKLSDEEIERYLNETDWEETTLNL